MFEDKLRKILTKAHEFPRKEQWQLSQECALALLQAAPVGRERPDLIRVDYPEGSSVNGKPVFDRPDPTTRPLILGNEFFSPAPEAIRAPQLEAWSGTQSLVDAFVTFANKRAHAVSFVELELEALRTLLRDERERRLLILTGVILRHENADLYPVLDYSFDEQDAPRSAATSTEHGRFLRFSSADKLRALAKNRPSGYGLVLV